MKVGPWKYGMGGETSATCRARRATRARYPAAVLLRPGCHDGEDASAYRVEAGGRVLGSGRSMGAAWIAAARAVGDDP